MESVGTLIAYGVIVLTIILFSVLAVTTRKILRAATYLLFALFGTAALYFQLDYEFLGAVQIAVYAGGIVVLFVFSILLTTHPGDNSPNLASRKRALGLLGAVAMAAVAGYALITRVQLLLPCSSLGNPDMNTLGEALLSTGRNGYLLPFEAVSVLLLACIIGGVVVARKR